MLKTSEETFIKDNLGLVHACCKRFSGRGIEYDDLFQAGSVGLLKATRDFDESRGFMFSTYAVPVILGEIKRVFRDTGAIKVSRSLKELSLKVTALSAKMEKENGEAPSVEALAEKLGCAAADVAEAISAGRQVLSLTYSDDKGEQEYQIPVFDESEKISNRILVSSALAKLPAEDRSLIYCRYYRGLTQSETADILGVTQVQVSRREKKLLQNLRSSFS